MKNILLLICCLCATLASAQTYTAEEQKEMARMLHVANKLHQKHLHLQAMDTATYALSLYEGSYLLKDFVRKNWDDAMKEAQDRLDTLLDSKTIRQVRERVQVYQYLVDINDNFRSISLPLYGRNNSWMWQPEIQYWAGHLNHELQLLQTLEEQEQKRIEQEEQERLRAEQTNHQTSIQASTSESNGSNDTEEE